ncbi:unnamed protein product [Clavelina lepadiformis]|uniref:Uncharacterized protein n=1 Tax=Clavelina lepadiformis TaxID=159417 RepID=A0ABP0GA57_CLALP
MRASIQLEKQNWAYRDPLETYRVGQLLRHRSRGSQRKIKDKFRVGVCTNQSRAVERKKATVKVEESRIAKFCEKQSLYWRDKENNCTTWSSWDNREGFLISSSVRIHTNFQFQRKQIRRFLSSVKAED